MVEKLTVQLELPRDLLAALNVPEKEFGFRLKELIALELFREGHISSGKAAELLDMPKAGFVQRLAQHGIPYFSETPEELSAQVTAAERLLDQRAS